MVRAILSAPGSRGDVNPMIAIGRQLRADGHDVVISLAEPYAEIAAAEGLQVEPVISRQQFEDAIGTASVWTPIRGPLAVFRLIMANYLPLHQQVIHQHHDPGNTVLVAHPLDLASRIFRDADPQTPLVSVLPQPVTLRTCNDPPRLSPWRFEFSRPAWAMSAAYWLADTFVLDPILRGKVNRQRRDYQLPPIRRVMDRWWLSPDRVLGMFPDWYAPATRALCPRLRHCGFPLDDVNGESFEPPVDRPIVFTAGTAHQHCRRFFEQAVQTCRSLNRPGILLSTHSANFPDHLPSSILALPYVSLGQLLPHCSVIVHHGGIGTTSQAMAAGIPQIIRPMAFDQFDNADRVEKLGVGRWLKRDGDLKTLLQEVLATPTSATLTDIKQRLSDTHGAATAAAEIENVHATHN
jgi:rhamnosyltransferase subunit B